MSRYKMFHMPKKAGNANRADERTTLQVLKEEAARFRDERGWKKFHKPSALAASLSIEAAELLELFQWKSEKEASIQAIKRNKIFRSKLNEELADVVLYCLAMASVLDIDIGSEVTKKLKKNRIKYPAKKYCHRVE